MIGFEPQLEELLSRLHRQSDTQGPAMGAYFSGRIKDGSLKWNEFDEGAVEFMSDKLVALDRDKAELCYHLCRALNATRVVEAGSSLGVSTLYLAAAVRDNVKKTGGGIVIGTEHEPQKAKAARANFAAAGLADYIDLREGDLEQTLKSVRPPIDFMLIDIWTPMARPALELVCPHLRPGAIVICDNTAQYRDAYRDYFDFVASPANGLRTMTLPFEGGLELTVKEPG